MRENEPFIIFLISKLSSIILTLGMARLKCLFHLVVPCFCQVSPASSSCPMSDFIYVYFRLKIAMRKRWVPGAQTKEEVAPSPPSPHKCSLTAAEMSHIKSVRVSTLRMNRSGEKRRKARGENIMRESSVSGTVAAMVFNCIKTLLD